MWMAEKRSGGDAGSDMVCSSVTLYLRLKIMTSYRYLHVTIVVGTRGTVFTVIPTKLCVHWTNKDRLRNLLPRTPY